MSTHRARRLAARPDARRAMTSLQTQIEAHAFRSLLAHLGARADVQNIDMMNLAGFCRNCCAKWTLLGAQKVGYPMTYDEACEYVYGEPYGEWKKKHQKRATEAQLRAFEENRDGHARHDELDMDRATASGGGGAFTGGGLTPIDASVTASEVCCEPADALLANARGGDEACARRPGNVARVRLGVLTCSDRASAGEYEDLSGPSVIAAMREYAAVSGSFTVVDVASATAADDVDAIETALADLTSRCDLVFTTGGTGCAPRDVTPEATSRVLARQIPGIPEAIRAATSLAEPRAALSRALAGVARSGALVLNLPGAPSAAKQWLGIALPLIPRVMETLAERP